jgi:anti-sigma B factor antagonist
MHAPLTLSTTPTAAGTCTLAVGGELDIATAPQFRTEVGALLGTGCRHLVVDLSQTTFMDSSGLGALVWASHRLRGAGGDLVAVDPNEGIVQTLRITGVNKLLALD